MKSGVMSFFKKTKTSLDKGKITISYSILGIGLIILVSVVGAIAILDYNFKWDIILREYISMSAFGCVAIGLIYNATSIQYSYELSKHKMEKEDKEGHSKKVKLTYEVISEWYKNDMATNAEITRRFIKPYRGRLNEPADLRDFKKELGKNENLNIRKSLISVLNYFEHLALLSGDEVINEEIVKKAFRTAFITLYTTVREYIEDEQRGNSGANYRIYINFVQLSKKWQKD
jgi:hypothetical protein